MIIRIVYSLFIGVLLATFVGVGIAAFYPAPERPEYPVELSIPQTKAQEESPEIRTQRIEQEKKQRDFQKLDEKYNKNVSIIAVVAAIIVLVVSLTLLRHILIIADGLLLGGVFTLIYSIIRGFVTNDNQFRFVVVTIGLITALTLGYLKFVKTKEKKSK